ncbi:MAG TPA: efflux RND transporter periplasmic adaptor subunit [Bryobacteraceae bacterium]|nr:efflux RND transporter periplasmic adaptor subunit [Bryobacteraceae bacterium]
MCNRFLLPLTAGLLLAAGCAKKEAKEAEPIAPVQVAPVRMDSIRRIAEADAALFPRDFSNVMPKIQAPVQRFLVNRGDHVKQGQLLAVLENRDLVAAEAASKGQLDQAQANLSSTANAVVPESVVKAQTDVQSFQEQFDAAKKVLESRQQLFKEGALPRKNVDDAQVAYAQAKAQLETAREHLRTLQSVGKQAQVDAAKAAVATAEGQWRSATAQVGYSEIRALISGVVSDRPVYPGDMAQPGTPLLTIVDISSVVARANVPQAQASQIKVGDPATIKITETAVEVPGKVTVVSPATDPASTTVQVWVQAANPGERLKPGASVHVSIVTETLKNVVVVPSSAILPGEDGGTAVLVLGADNTVHQKKVEVGVREADKVQILSGASPGDQVVTVGGVGLDDNAKVRVVEPGEKDEDEKPADENPAGGAKKDEKD